MFNSKENVQWYAERYNFTHRWRHDRTPWIQYCAMANYRNLLIAAFTFLFNERLKNTFRK